MAQRDDLDQRAQLLAMRLLEQVVTSSEQVDFRSGTYLLASLAAELGQQVQQRCWELARDSDSRWELAVAEAENLINGAWSTMELIARLSNDFRVPGPPASPEED